MRLLVGLCACLIGGALPAFGGEGAHPDKTPELNDGEKSLLSQGYRLEVKNGQKIFCRREVVVGSHLEKKVCGTAEELAASTQTSRDVTDRTQRVGLNPTGH